MTRRTLGERHLFLRADATSRLGVGHLMRLLALGQAWLDLGGQATAITAEAPRMLLDRFVAEGIDTTHVEVPSGGLRDAACVRDRLTVDPRAVAVVDGPAFGPAYLDALDPVADRVMLVDDLASFPRYPVAAVLNQNAHADRAAYPAGSTCEFMLGLQYVMLRREFRAPPPRRSSPPVARRLLITFGGADPGRMTERCLDALPELPKSSLYRLTVRVLVGPTNPRRARISSAADRARAAGIEVSLLSSVADMPAQLAWTDLVITSGGSTVWELCRYGCPSLIVQTAPAEDALARGLARFDLFERLGRERALPQALLTARIGARMVDMEWRQRMSALGARLVDGMGAERVARLLAEL